MPVHDLLVYIFLFAGVVFSISGKKLSVAGALTGGLIGFLIYQGAGVAGIGMLAFFFLSGSFATGWQIKKKTALGIAEQDKGRRTTMQVIANGGVPAILAGIAWYRPELSRILIIMLAGSFASATADTLSSELGSVYGKRFYDILSFRKVSPGPDGVVSLEGTLIGICGAVLIAAIYALGFGSINYAFAIVLAGAIGNLADSLLGATLERRKIIGNDAVNFLNTCVGAGICWVIQLFFKN